jgi:hypothetical protein
MGQMGQMGMQRPPMRQGTSHIVPVVVSAGLAVGVFCGLLFGLGMKKTAEPAKASNGAKQSAESLIQAAPVSMGSDKAPDKPPAKAGSEAAAAAGSAAPATGSAAPVVAAPAKPSKLMIDIKPDSVAQSAKIFIDGKQLTTGTTADIAFDPGTQEKTVKVLVQASGYQDEQRDQSVRSEEANTSLSIQMKPVRAAPSGGTPTGGASAGGDDGSKAGTGGGGKGGGNKGTGKGSGKGKGSGLIDI